VSTVLGIVYALLVLAIVIAVSGIASTLSLAVYERTRETGLLRAAGQTRPQLRPMVRLESVLVSAFGTAGACCSAGSPAGPGRGRARSSGLTMVSFPATQLIVIAGGVAAAICPARRQPGFPCC
jgi:putative ABC transport system permease protein